MKVIAIIITSLLLTSFPSAAQKNQLFVGGSIFFPASIPGHNNTTGYGLRLNRQHFFGKHWTFDMNIGYTYFSGEVTDWEGNKQNHFALFPVSIGTRYYVKHFYAGLHTGVAIKGSSNTGTNLMFSPFVGYRINKFQIEARLLGIPQTFATYPEKTYLQKGGYSYIGFGVEYRLSKKS